MTRPRKPPNMKEKLASALLHIRRGVEGDDWLIKGELREASAKEICAAIDWDHVRRWAEGGSNDPQNLQPLMRAEHREKSRKDTTEVAKGKRMAKKQQAHEAKLIEKLLEGTAEKGTRWPSQAKIPSRPFPSREERKKLKERYSR